MSLYLSAQDTRRQAELALATNRLARLKNYLTLCLALGGGGMKALRALHRIRS